MEVPSKFGSLGVLFFAENDDNVEYIKPLNLLVDGEQIDEVNYLTICRESFGERNFLLVFCNNFQNIEGLIRVESVEKAKKIAEKYYKGIDENWKKLDECKTEVVSAHLLAYCTFCKKPSSEVFRLYGTDDAVICDECIEAFYEYVQEDKGE